MRTRHYFSALFSIIITVSLLQSCGSGRPLVQAPAANNQTYRVDYLFEHDGCKVYRFYDQGNFVYFTNRSGSVTAIQKDSTENRVYTVGLNER